MTVNQRPPISPSDFYRLKRIFTRTYKVPVDMSFDDLISSLSEYFTNAGAARDSTIPFSSLTPGGVDLDGTGAPGSSGSLSRGDHTHGLTLHATAMAIFDGAGSALSAGMFADVSVDFPCTITAARLLVDPSGDAVVDVRRSTYAGFPGSLASLCASAKPTVSGAPKSEDTTLTGWTKVLAAGDVLRLYLESATTVENLTLALKLRRDP